MIKLLGIPSDFNSSFMQGPALAPDIIRQMDIGGSANPYAEDGTRVKVGETYTDLGDLNIDSTLDAQTVNNQIITAVASAIKDDSKLVCFGGDHSVSYPIIKALSEKYSSINILHFDAHPDLYHNFQDNPYSHASPFARIMENELATFLTQVGIRTLDKHQRTQVEKFNVKVFEMKDFDLKAINEHVSQLTGPLYISIDIDALDPSCAPGVSHHEPGGLFTRDLLTIIQNIDNEVIGADIVELNPKTDINKMTAMVAYKIFKELVALLMKK